MPSILERAPPCFEERINSDFDFLKRNSARQACAEFRQFQFSGLGPHFRNFLYESRSPKLCVRLCLFETVR